jgi:hypothetical protein
VPQPGDPPERPATSHADIKSCRDCHVSARSSEHIEDKLASDCSMCHSFHFGSSGMERISANEAAKEK